MADSRICSADGCGKPSQADGLKRDAFGRIAANHVDLPIGMRFDRLTVIGDEQRDGKNYAVSCRCDCGRIVRARVDGLISGNKKQCGNHARVVTEAHRAAISERTRTHGMSRSAEYSAWVGMKMRCFNPKDGRYEDYGGRGISVYPKWALSFEAFIEFMGLKPSPMHSLDRIDVDGDYVPGNVRWASPSAQTRNRRPFMVRPGTGRKLRPLPPPADYIPPQPLAEHAHHNARHGMSGSPEYCAWRSMKKRCLDPRHPAYRNYGGRGISIHDEWQHNFASFLAEIGLRPGAGYSLDRIDNELGYVPGNVRWSDAMTQNRNRRAFLIKPRG